MSEHKFTPGPWRACGENRGICQCGMIWSKPADFPVAAVLSTCERHGSYNSGEGIDPNTEEFAANAKLVAASPELLAACQAAFHTLEALDFSQEIDPEDNGIPSVINDLRAAISKATATAAGERAE